MRVIVVKLVKGDDLPIKGNHHDAEYRRGNQLLSIHATTAQKDIVVKLCID